jgi:hypothetical protein
MLVSGGWRGRVRLASALGGLIATGMIAMMGCGGRTSMLDAEAYELGGSGFGGSFTSGGKATGTAGTLLLPSAGRPGNPTMDQCALYCNGYAKTCASELKGQDCQRVCQAEIDGFGAKCQVLGITAIECLTPFFQPGNGSCETATTRGLALCGDQLADFKSCETGTPTPNPNPNPTPTPVDRTTCPNMGGISPGSCDVVFACLEGTYRTSCSVSPDGRGAHCFCYAADTGWMGEVPTSDSSVACYLAVSQCPASAADGMGGFQ